MTGSISSEPRQRREDRRLGGDLLRGADGGLDVGEVAHRLDEHEVDAARDEPAQLLGEELLRRLGGQGAEPCMARRGRVPPKVFVVTTREPASR